MTIKEKIMKIMSLALEINPPEIDDIGKKRTAVFVEWEPHCPYLEVKIFLNGWRTGKSPDERFAMFLTIENPHKRLDEIIERLEEIKESEASI